MLHSSHCIEEGVQESNSHVAEGCFFHERSFGNSFKMNQLISKPDKLTTCSKKPNRQYDDGQLLDLLPLERKMLSMHNMCNTTKYPMSQKSGSGYARVIFVCVLLAFVANDFFSALIVQPKW